jgi:hypothetical protein
MDRFVFSCQRLNSDRSLRKQHYSGSRLAAVGYDLWNRFWGLLLSPDAAFQYTSAGLPSSLSGSNGCCSASLSASASGQGSSHLTYTAAAAAGISSGYARSTASQLTIVSLRVEVTSTLRTSWRPLNGFNEFGEAGSQLRNPVGTDFSSPLSPGTYILIVDTFAHQDTGPP